MLLQPVLVETKDQLVTKVQPAQPVTVDHKVLPAQRALLQPAQVVTKVQGELKVLRVETLALVLRAQ